MIESPDADKLIPVIGMKSRFFLRTAALAAAALLLSGLTAASAAAPAVSAQSAILYDCGSGRVLYEKDAHSRQLIASTTKIMTGLLVCERANLDDRVQIPPEAVGIEGSSLYLKAGETLTVRELLQGMMLHSGNDAAMALAIYCAGTPEGFVDWMNEKAEMLGLEQTRFANPHGLDDENNYSTAYDMAHLAAYAMENPLFREVVSTKNATISGRSLTNHNKLLWRCEGAVGVKTGYTRQAGRILASAVEREGRRLVAVTMNAPSDWDDHMALMDYGFSAFETSTWIEQGEKLAIVPVISGEIAAATVSAAEPFSYALLPQEEPEVRLLLPRMAYAPLQQGMQAGVAQIVLHGQIIGQVELVWDQNTAIEEEPGLFSRLFGGA